MLRHATQLIATEDPTPTRVPQIAITAGGVLVLLSLLGLAGPDWLWWVLIPASGLLAFGLISRPWFAEQGAPRMMASASAAVLAASVVTTAIGYVTVTLIGVEPSWLEDATDVIAISITVAFVALGVLISRCGLPGPGFLLAASLPAGIAIDWALARVLPPGFFLAGAGYYVGMFLFGYSLMRIARKPTQPAQ